MEQNLRIADLISAYLQQRLTPDEEKELNDWLEARPENRELFGTIANEHNLDADLAAIKSFDAAAALEKIRQFPQSPIRKKIIAIRWPRIAAAASIILCLSVGGYFILHKKPIGQTAQNQPQDIAPGSNKAILTLANGKKIIITGASNGRIATQSNTVINKTAEGKLNYEQTGDAQAEPMMNTLSTQMGGETSLTLADGTEVKLDATSSISYPVAFNGKDRRVSVTGQVYFKVKHNTKQPFYVSTGGQTIEDIGTEFNVNAYETTKTTLVEGSITVNGQKLIPGQQAALAGSNLIISEVNTDEVTGWAQGVYQFNGQDIHAIMDQIKRWYNIEVKYAPDVSTEKFYATVARNKNISQIFYNLGYTQKVHFKIDGRRVTVMK